MPAPHSDSPSRRPANERRNRTFRGWRGVLPVYIFRSPVGWQIQVAWRRLVASIALMALVGYIGAAAAVFFINKHHRGFSTVRFMDILLPHRWDDFQASRGRYYIQLAKKDLEEGRFNQAFHHLRAGLAKVPEDRDARLLLAQFYASSRRPDLAQRTLLDGLPLHQENLEYLKAAITFLLAQQADDLARQHARELLADNPEITPRNQLLALAIASASYFRGNYDETDDYLNRYKLDQTRDGRLLAARIERDRGLTDLAIVRLQSLAQELPGDQEIYSTLVSWLRESGRISAARQLSISRQLEAPELAQPHIDLLYIYNESGDSRVEAAEDAVLEDFAADPKALIALADYAANSGRPDLARRIYDHFLARGFPWDATALMLVESHVVAGQYQKALDITRTLMKENPEWAARFAAVFHGLQAIAFHGLGDKESGQLFLSNFLDQTNVRAENLIAVSNRLLAIGAYSQARQVLAKASARDPQNQAALSGLIKLDLQLGRSDALIPNVERLLTMRKPSHELLRDAYRELGSDRFLFLKTRRDLLDQLNLVLNPAS